MYRPGVDRFNLQKGRHFSSIRARAVVVKREALLAAIETNAIRGAILTFSTTSRRMNLITV